MINVNKIHVKSNKVKLTLNDQPTLHKTGCRSNDGLANRGSEQFSGLDASPNIQSQPLSDCPVRDTAVPLMTMQSVIQM